MRRVDPEQLIRDVGRRVAEERRARNLTQEELAARVQLGIKHLQKIELGMNLTVRSIARLANHLGVAPHELLLPPRDRRTVHGRPPGKKDPAR